MPLSGRAGFAGAAVCAAGLQRGNWWRACERRRLRCRFQAVPALPARPSAPLACNAGIRGGRLTAERPLVSVCVPVYNAERWLAGALESAIAQTYEEHESVGLVFAPREVEVAQAPDPEWGELFARPHEYFSSLERVNDGRRLFRELLDTGFEGNWVGEPSAVLVTRGALEHVGLLNERLHQIAALELWGRIMVSCRVGFVDKVLSVYRHHGESGTVRNASSQR